MSNVSKINENIELVAGGVQSPARTGFVSYFGYYCLHVLIKGQVFFLKHIREDKSVLMKYCQSEGIMGTDRMPDPVVRAGEDRER